VDFTLRLLATIETGEASGIADTAFDLLRDELTRYPFNTPESRELFTAFLNAYSKDEAAVSYLARLKGKVTPIVSICYYFSIHHHSRCSTSFKLPQRPARK
jgi:hypothetical protein